LIMFALFRHGCLSGRAALRRFWLLRNGMGKRVTQVESGTADQVGRLYDQMAGFESDNFSGDHNLHFGYWDTPGDTSSLDHAEERFTELMIEKLQPKPGGRVLDVGCGMGTPAIRLANSFGGEVVGVTVSHEQVSRAGSRAAAQGLEPGIGRCHSLFSSRRDGVAAAAA